MTLRVEYRGKIIGEINNIPLSLKLISNLLDELAESENSIVSSTFEKAYMFLCEEYSKLIEKELNKKNVLVLGFKETNHNEIEIVEISFS